MDWQDIVNKLHALEYRERLLMLVTIIVVLLFLWEGVVLGRQLEKNKNLKTEISTLSANNKQEVLRSKELQIQVLQDPNVREQIRLDRYKKEISRLDKDLKLQTVEFISPKQMIDLLKKLMLKEPGLELTSLQSTGPELPIFKGEEKTNIEEVKDDSLNIYLHGLEMQFKGDFFTVLNYVKRIESLSWRFSWDSLTITIDGYPLATVNIRLETLSLEEGWIGV